MKKLLMGSALVLSMTSLYGQDATSVVGDLFSPRRIVKTNLVGYALLAVNANYEQMVGPKTSVGLLGGYKIPSTIHIAAIGKLDGENQTYTGDIEPKGLFLNPYFRFYTGQKVFRGFYLEAFARYYDYTFLVPYDYDKDGRTIRANLDGTASGIGGGLAFGVQVPLGPRVFLDFNLGYGMASGDAHVETNDPNLDAEDYQSIKRNIEKHRDEADVKIFALDKVISNIEANANSSSAWADIEGQMFPIVRAGIAIGFAF
jgi:hypothetical protein